MKKFISLVLALVMALSLTTVAWGATTHPVTSFAELKTALTNAVDGDTINVTGTVVINENIDIDLTGLTVTNNASGHMFSIVSPATEVTITGGTLTIPADNITSHGFVDINTAAKVVINGGTYSGKLVDDPTNASGLKYVSFFTNPAAGVELELKGVTATSNRLLVYADQYFKTLTVTGGAYTSDFAAFAVGAEAAGVNVRFSDVTATASGSIVVDVVGAGANNTKAVFTNCTITSSKVVAGDSNDFKSTALAASYGAEVTIDGGTYTAKGEAITVSESGGTIIVKGGTFNSEEAIGLPNDKGSYGSSGTNSTIEIQGGTFNGPMTTPTTANESLTVSGGTFSSDVSDYVAAGKDLISDGAGGYVIVDESANSWGTLYGKKTTVAGATIGAVTLEYYKAVAPIYNDDGIVTNQPSIDYYLCPELTGTTYLVEVASLGAADVVVYNDVDGKVVFKYLDIVNNVEYEGNGVAFTNFGKACGQYKDANYDKTATYYTFENVVYKAVETSATALMVNGKVVPVVPATGAFVQHIASYTYNDKFEVTAVKCGVCGTPAVIVPNYASLPDAVKAVSANNVINGNMYFYWPAATGTTGETVESAKTFDAGIAMYVGMSVMAAAGSAVVLKKKD